MHAADAADADRELDIRELGHTDAAHGLLDLLFLLEEDLLGHAREQEQELVPAVADEYVGLADAGAYRARDVAQRRVSGGVAAGIVDVLEAVHVDERYALHALEVGAVGLEIAARIDVGQRVEEQLPILAARAVEQEARAVRVDPAAIAEPRDHLEHAGRAVDDDVLRDDEIHLVAGKFELVERGVLGKGASGDAVGAAAVAVPERGAALARAVQHAVRVDLEHGIGLRVDQTDDVKDCAEAPDLVGEQRPVRRALVRTAEGRAAVLLLLRVGHDADHADIAAGRERRPERVHPDVVPVLLAADRQEQADGKLVVLGRRGLEGAPEPRDVGRTQRAQIVRVVHVHDRPALLPRTAPVDHEDRLGERIVLELHAAAAGREEDQLFSEDVHLALGAVAARHIVLFQQLGGKALRVLFHALLDREQRQRVLEAHADLLKAVEQHRIERAALPVEDHGDGGFVAVRLFVAAVARQRVVYVRERDHLRRDRDLLAEQAVRVAAAVPALVMPAADLDRGLEQRLLAVRRQPLEHGRADGGMGADDVELLGRQAARLVEDALGNADLADVVQGGGGDDEADLFLGQMIYVGLFAQPAQQHPGHGLHLEHVLSALAVAELDDVAEDADHDIIIPLVAVDLVGDHAHQPLLGGVERERVLDAALNDERVEGTADVVGNAETVAAPDGFAVVVGGDHDDRDLVDPAELVHVLEHGKAVHLRHIDVEQHQVDVQILPEHPERLRAVHCLCVFVSLAQDGLEHFSVHLRVVNDQDFLSVHSRSTAVGSLSLPLSDFVGFSLFYYTTKAMQNKDKFRAPAPFE